MENLSINSSWYTIFNPTSGGGTGQKNLDKILSIFNLSKITYQIITTQYAHHEEELVQAAIKKGYLNFICIGGDGTIHHMINGIMKQKYTDSRQIKLAVIPTGTGNDWVKNYNIPRDPKKAINLILNNKIIYQDVGKINLTENNKEVFFNNAAGIGFDAFVVKRIPLYKKWGSLAYLIAGLISFTSYKKSNISYTVGSRLCTSEMFMISLGICRYSGGGMQLTDFKHHKNGYFDLTFIKSIQLFRVITNIFKLYNGNINDIRETECSHIKKFDLSHNKSCYIQADGELIGKGDAKFELIPRAIQMIIS